MKFIIGHRYRTNSGLVVTCVGVTAGEFALMKEDLAGSFWVDTKNGVYSGSTGLHPKSIAGPARIPNKER